jgi:ligand-binding sensor domain-containing protein
LGDNVSTVLRARRGPVVFLLGVLAAACPAALALNPSLEISQYGHTSWTIRDGFFKGSVYAIAQSANGYLLLRTEFGLAHFDGIRNTARAPPSNQPLPSTNVRSLLVARDGTLWIGTIEGLVSWKDGQLTRYPELAGQHPFTLIEDREGTLWAGTYSVPNAKLCAIRAGIFTCYGQDGIFGQWVESLYEDSGGHLWAGTATGLWRWKPGPPQRYSPPHLIESDQAILEDEAPSRLIVLCQGVWRMAEGKAEPYPLRGVPWPFTPLNILRDRDGGLWIGTLEHGLLHSYRGRTDVFSRSDGLSGNHIRSLFEDREGNIWVATTDGLDRFRSLAATTFSVRQGLSSPSAMSVVAARDGSVWTGTEDGSNRWKNGAISIYRASAPPRQAGPADPEGVHRGVREIVDRGLADNQVGSLFEDDRGRVWVSAYRGISRFENGRFQRLAGPPGGWVNGITGDGSGGVWIAYQDLGLFHVEQDRVVERFPWAKLGHGLAATMMLDPRTKGLWLGFFQGGLAYFQVGRCVRHTAKKRVWALAG